eukprot:403358185
MAFQLSGDGIVENLYHLLWTKDSMFHKKAKIPIPHTIIYKFEQPAHWYFTSKQGELMKRRGQNLSVKEIENEFLKKMSKSGIVAYYIYNKKEKNIISVLNKQDQRERASQKTATGEYESRTGQGGGNKKNRKEMVDEIHEFIENQNDELDQAYIENKEKNGDQIDFLYNRPKPYDGILQKFIDPSGDYNKRLQGSQICETAQKLTEKIAKHLSNVTFDKCRISRLVLHFKTDRKDNIKFLWCSSLRVENDKDFPPTSKFMNNAPLRLDSCLQVTEQVRQVIAIDKSKPFGLYKESICYSCFKPIEPDKLYPIKYSVLIKDHEKRNNRKDIITLQTEDYESNFKLMEHQRFLTIQGPHVIPPEKSGIIKFDAPIPEKELLILERAQTQQSAMIPFIIRILHPRLKADQYVDLLKDVSFLSRVAYICEDCFLYVTMSSEAGGKYNREVTINDLYGTQDLNPSKTTRNEFSEIKNFTLKDKFMLSKRTQSQENLKSFTKSERKLSLPIKEEIDQVDFIAPLKSKQIQEPISIRKISNIKNNDNHSTTQRFQELYNQEDKKLFSSNLKSNRGGYLTDRQISTAAHSFRNNTSRSKLSYKQSGLIEEQISQRFQNTQRGQVFNLKQIMTGRASINPGGNKDNQKTSENNLINIMDQQSKDSVSRNQNLPLNQNQQPQNDDQVLASSTHDFSDSKKSLSIQQECCGIYTFRKQLGFCKDPNIK